MQKTITTKPYSVVPDGNSYRISGTPISRSDFTIQQLHTVADMLNSAYLSGASDKAFSIREELGI